MNQMAAVELGRDVNREIEVSKGGLRHLPIGNGNGKVATHADEHLHLASEHRFKRGNHVVAMVTRHFEAEAVFKPIEELLGGYFGNPDRTIALHIGMATDRTEPGPLASDITAQQRKI